MPTLIAKERGFYNGRNREPNEEFEAQENDVRFLTEGPRPFARFPAERSGQNALALGPSTAPEKPKRRYLRRDMRAKE